ncbi:peptidylprolyl isomerase [Stratiformator vulcanicus]|uniref:peptidylprolyl isomerase n=1 Tax=Stratiformator vulcanicus TaxID=2527980 RepID=A0A517R5D5_9PLAN|nr:peptidylprolyl isomerase [Stratiformator vulcanicus]QDT39106.1 Foldase protein PrsA 3 precursor [Stratiformator vulcanicus]
MGERNHAAPEGGHEDQFGECPFSAAFGTEESAPETATRGKMTTRQKQVTAVLGGVTLAVVAGGVMMQFFTGEPGTAAERTGHAAVSTQHEVGKQTVARPHGVPATLATVAGEAITYDEVQREAFERFGTETLEKLINRKIIESACATRGVQVSIEEVEQEITTIAQGFNLDRENWLQMLQAERGLTPLQYKRDVIWPMIALKKLAGADVEITTEDIGKVFARDFGPRVKAEMIMLDNQRRAQEVWTRARRNPEEFGRLAREFSIEPTSKSLDGKIPPIRRYSGQEELEEKAFQLKLNEISGIVQLPMPGATRYVILKCTGRTEPIVTDLALVRDEIVEQIRKEKIQEAVANIFTELQKSTLVVNYLTHEQTGIRQVGATTTAPARN